MSREKIRHAIILAGGKGERLRPLTADRPKPMVALGGEPILYYQLRQLVKAGVEEVIFACSYHHEVLQSEIGDGKKFSITAKYSVESEPLGRGGGIKKAMRELSPGWQDVFVTNGDNLWKVNLTDLANRHQQSREALATIVLVPLKSPYGIVEINKRMEVQEFREKPVLPSLLVNAGVYVFASRIEPLLPDIGDHETTTFQMLRGSPRLLGYPSDGYWRGIDTVKDLKEAEADLPLLQL